MVPAGAKCPHLLLRITNSNLELFDDSAGYYTSYERVIPTSVKTIDNAVVELALRNIELRILPNLVGLAQEVKKSSFEFSLIRMRNAKK